MAQKTYTVKSGDTLYKIAKDLINNHNLTGYTENDLVNKLIYWNKSKYPTLSTNPGYIQIGWQFTYYDSSEENNNTDNPNTGENKTEAHMPGESCPNAIKFEAYGFATLNGVIYRTCSLNGNEQTNLTIKEGNGYTIDGQCNKHNAYHIIGSGWVKKDWIRLETMVTDAATVPPDKIIYDYNQDKPLISGMYGTRNVQAEHILIKNNHAIECMPYQFLPSVDNRFSEEIKFGRTYVDKIVSKMPLLLLSPGTPDFMSSYSDDDKKTVLSALLSEGHDKYGSIRDNLSELLKGENHRYYTFKYTYNEYFWYFSKMMRYGAHCLGIENVKHPTAGGGSVPFGSYSWQQEVNEELKTFISAREVIPFYIDAETSITENISSSTTDSPLSGSFDSISDMAREIYFLAGPIAGSRRLAEKFKSENFREEISDISEAADKLLGSTKLFSNIEYAFRAAAKGGRIQFPQIWSDSEFSKSYDVSFKLRTPDCDKISWYLNMYKPLMKLLCFAAPREMGSNSYMSPFLCRAYYKGLFNIDLGLITDMQISKGKEGSWTIDGLPTEIDVSFTIKELYQTLTLSGGGGEGLGYTLAEDPWRFFKNTGLVDYLATTCGININTQEISRMVKAYVSFALNNVHDTFGGIWGGLTQAGTNIVSDIYSAARLQR